MDETTNLIYMITLVTENFRAPQSKAEVTVGMRFRRALMRALRVPIRGLRLIGQPSLDTRPIGYFPTLDRACQAVLRDEGGLVMARYDWAVIERISPGIHAAADAPQRWFHYEHGAWRSAEAPEFARGTVGFAMG